MNRSIILTYLLTAAVVIGFMPFDAHAQVLINEFSAANISGPADNFGEQEDWIELYNTSASAMDLSGYYLSDRLTEPTKWAFPNGTSINAGGFLRVWASGRNVSTGSNFHTNFKITQTQGSEDVVLADASGTVIDYNDISIPSKQNHAIARRTNGGPEWGIATTPSPNASNNNVKKFYATTPLFDLPAGGYSSPITVTISSPDSNVSIRYTIDGSVPTGASPLYTTPIPISQTTVVRAIAFSSDPDIPSSFVETNTYFINVTHTIKIISLAGQQVQQLLEGDAGIEPTGSVEIFNPDFDQVSETFGDFNKHGNDSWAYDQRGIDYIVQDEYGYDYAVKSDLFDHSITQRDKFQRLILKAAANDNYPAQGDGAHIRDAFAQTLSQRAGLELDERTYTPCVVYLNGNYWGVYEIREKVDDNDFTEYYYNKDGNEIDYIKTWGATWAEYGDMNDWNTLRDFILNNDMANTSNYQFVTERLNVLSLIDYIILDTYIVCQDWLNWNTSWWHSNDNQVKWRYTLWDLDATFNHYINYTGIPDTSPDAEPCNVNDPGVSDPESHISVLNALFQNPDFEELYINRYADLNNTYFNCNYMLPLLDSLINNITPEMPQHINRWGGSMTEWQNNVQTLRDFIQLRCGAISAGITDCYEVEPINLTFIVEPPGSGTITIDGYNPSSFPWSGIYYENLVIDLIATPAAGFELENWEAVNNGVSNPNNTQITLEVQTDGTVIAHFAPPAPEYPFTVTTDPIDGGSVTLNGISITTPYTESIEEGTNIVLTATPAAGYQFDYWETQFHTLIPTNTDTTVLFVLQNTDLVTAHFSLIPIPLNISIDISGNGSINLDNNNLTNFPLTLNYNAGDTLNPTAIPETGYTFDHWEWNGQALPDGADLSLILAENGSLTAVFSPIALTITLVINPENGGTVNINGLPIANNGTVTINYNDLVALTATPAEGYTFTGWTSLNTSIPTPNQTNTSFAAISGDTITANFSQNTATFTLNFDGIGGTVSVNGQTISDFPYTMTVQEGSTVTITADNESEYIFGGWTGLGSNTNNMQQSITFTVTDGQVISLTFIAVQNNCGPLMPTAFSPNGDGINDQFRIITACSTRNFSLHLYNRWGNEVYAATSIDNAWNGQYNGKMADMGVYIWVVNFELLEGGAWVAKKEKGNITLLR